MVRKVKSVLSAVLVGLLIASTVLAGGFFQIGSGPAGGYPSAPTFTTVGANVVQVRDNVVATSGATDLVGFRDGSFSGSFLSTGKMIAKDPWFDVRAYGAKCDNVTDDSAAVIAATAAAAAAGGGEIRFPTGWCRIVSQWALSVDNNTTRMKPLKITGAGADHVGVGNLFSPMGGTVLRLEYSAGPKISTKNVGRVEFSGINFFNPGTDNQAFVYTEGTTLHVHHSAFWGGPNRNDGIVFGGLTDATGFQGYGTVVDSNLFQRVLRAGYFRRWANAIVFTNNNIWSGSGGVAAIELDGIAPQAISGNFVSGNLIEGMGYTYAVKLTNAQQNYFSNGVFDAASIIPYYLTNSAYNVFVESASSGGNPAFVASSDSSVSNSTILRTQQAQATKFGAGPVEFLSYQPKVMVAGYGPSTYSGTTDNVWSIYQHLYSAGGKVLDTKFVSDNGAVTLFGPRIKVYPDASWVNGTTELMQPVGDFRIQVTAGKQLELWGDTILFKNSSGVQGTINIPVGGSTVIGAGTGTVKMSSGNSANSKVWIPLKYNGVTYYVPGWDNNAP